MARKKQTSYWVFKAVPSRYTEAAERDHISELTAAISSRHGCLGILDWSVTIGDTEKVLAVEAEFLDLSARAGESHPLELWFATAENANAARRELERVFPTLKTTIPAREAKRDWMKLWRRHYHPLQIVQNGEVLWIVPSWQKFPAGSERSIVVRIQPGQAFGTGTHPTTELCLRACFEFGARNPAPKSLRILDFGAGTGILGIAALKWAKKRKWRASLVTSEIDPEARLVLEQNRKLNRVALNSRVSLPKSGGYDIVFANVLSPVLLAQKKALLARVAPGGILILSGILREDGAKFIADFTRGAGSSYSNLRSLYKEDWAAFVVGRKPKPISPRKRAPRAR